MSDNNENLLRSEMDRQGIKDPELRAGIAAIVGGESGWVPHTETAYNHTSNDRIRSIFKTALAGQSDVFIDDLKADPVRFFEYVYGRDHGPRNPQGGNALGNTEAGDGYKFRGRGGPQLTGRANYTKLSQLTGLDLVGNPDLVNQPENSAIVTVAYMRWRYHGGGWPAIKAAVGNSFGNVDDTKNQLFERYLASGEFNAGADVQEGQARPAPQPAKPAAAEPDEGDAIDDWIEKAAGLAALATSNLQSALTAGQLYNGPIDGVWNAELGAALDGWQK